MPETTPDSQAAATRYLPALFDLDLKHADYHQLEPARVKSRDLWSGPFAVKAAKKKYLFPFALETEEQYDKRLQRAVYDNWPAVVLETRHALLWRKTASRKIPSPIAAMENDVDGMGTDAEAFFQTVSMNAEVDGVCWVLADMPPLPPEAATRPLSLAEERDLGRRPYFAMLRAADVFDWAYNRDDHALEYAVIAQDVREKPGPGMPAKLVERRLFWTRSAWRLCRRADVTDGKARWLIEAEGPNPLRRVPLVPFHGVRERPGFGWPTVRDILDHAISIYNKFSDRDTGERLSNNPIPYMIAPKNPESVDISGGKGIFLSSAQEGGGPLGGAGSAPASIGYLEPTCRGIEASRVSERDLIRRIFEIGLRQAKRDSAQVQAADSLRFEGRVLDGSLAAVSRNREDCERRCWELAARWAGQVGSAGAKVEITYNRDFDDHAIDAAMIGAMSNLALKGQISVATLHDALKRGELLPADFASEEELRRIQEDAERATLFGGIPGGAGA